MPEAILLGIILFRSHVPVVGLPLWDFHADFVRQWILPGLYILLIGLILSGRSWLKPALGLCLAEPVLIFLFKYSANKAFSLAAFFYYAFYFITLSLRRRQRSLAAKYFLALVFLISGVQKLNTGFLSGNEFSPASSAILVQIHTAFPSRVESLLSGLGQELAYLTVATELAAGVLLVFSPFWGAGFALLFLVLLCFANQHVNYVFLLTLPLILELHPFIKVFFRKCRFKALLDSPFFWFSAFWLWNQLPYQGAGYFLVVVPFLLTLGISILIFFIANRKHAAPRRTSTFRPNLRIFAPSALVVLYYLANLAFAPAPTGFSMFSSKSFRHGWRRLDLESERSCQWIQNEISIRIINDSRFFWKSPKTCAIMMPTQGGLNYVTRKVCKVDPATNFTQSSSETKTTESKKCPDKN
ncbi:MAG: hypothetical protein ACK5Y2_07825 [Bdellovibrionales bacterium]